MDFSCISVRIAETACPLTNSTQTSNLRDSLVSTTVKTDKNGNFKIYNEYNQTLSQKARYEELHLFLFVEAYVSIN